jgi:hypothetical protein
VCWTELSRRLQDDIKYDRLPTVRSDGQVER